MTDRPNGPEHDKAMSLIDHLTELRNRIIICIAAFFVGFLILFPFAEGILQILLEPVREVLTERGEAAVLITTKPQEFFFSIMRISMLGGFLIAFPITAYEFWAFVSPGLYKNEKAAVLPFMVGSFVMFILGALFAHYAASPLAMNFFIGFSDIIPNATSLLSNGTVDPDSLKFRFDGKVEDVLDINLKLIFAFGLCFQMPVALTLLGKLGLITADGLKRARRYAIVGIMILSAVLTPPDVMTQLVLFTVVYGLYEISVWLVIWVQPKLGEEEENEPQTES